MYGSTGKLLRVDLTRERIQQESITEKDVRLFFGGRGLGTKILYERLEPGIDPLGPKNLLLFMAGPIVGTMIPGNSRHCVMCKSPLTGGLGEAHAAGFLGPQIKFAGYDGIIVEGAAKSPKYIYVSDEGTEIQDASRIWGKTTHETEAIVKKEIRQPRASVASIGIGGENLVRYACVLSDLHRAAGRTGVGAVMGSKRLKALAVYGKKRVPVAKQAEAIKLTKEITAKLLNYPAVQNLHKYGTAFGVPGLNAQGILPTKNFREGAFDGAAEISGEAMTARILKRAATCYACPVACIRVVEVKEGPYKGDFNDGPEYETVASFGSLLMNPNLESIAMANHLCNLHSVDTISVGVAIAFAMECYEKGILTKRDTGGLDLTWGNHGAVMRLIERIAKREGIGNVLADGVKRAAEKIGRGSEEFAVETKGLEIPLHEPRGKKGVGLSYATANRGGVHTECGHDTDFERANVVPELGIVKPVSRFSWEDKVDIIKKTQDLAAVSNSMILCRFTSFPTYRPTTVTDLVNVVRYVTGWDFTVEEFMRVGERVNNLGRMFNAREGMRRKDDRLPKRFSEPLLKGTSEGQKIPPDELNRVLDEYYALRGWNKQTGVPTLEKLKELDLGFATKDIGRTAGR